MYNAPESFFPAMQNFMQAGQTLTQHFLNYLASQQNGFGQANSGLPPMPVVPFAAPPQEALNTLQRAYLERHTELWNSILAGGSKAVVPKVVEAAPGDRRFAAPAWNESPIYSYVSQAYLLNARFVNDLVELIPVDDEKSKNRLRFLARQYIDALAPTNFAATNPEFVKLALESKGQSITEGINNLIADLEKGRISMTDESVFEVGTNLANTPGAVIYENALIQLIQYSPTTPKVAKRPLVIVPPCINKFYILDLQPENSFVRYAVDQGHTVFLVSWRNPKADSGHLGWDDYLENGPIAALRVAKEICKVDQVNALGFCVGGTILSSALAVLRARGEDPVSSLTLLTTLLDFSDTGEIGLFIDEATLASREAAIGKGGVMQGKELAAVFSSLRANDLIWNYVTSNYLKGQKPQAFDLLYWNSDSTNLPGPFACWYMRNLYHNNSLRIPGKLEMCGEKADLARVDMPSYILATREDHIVPWQTAYQSTRLLGGESKFVLGASGHIAGVVNPASKNKRSFWHGGDLKSDPETWLSQAEEAKGSWWVDWSAWLANHAGGQVAARGKLGATKYKEIEPAPGRYVKEKA
jgi:polyhydroxyalkanoate synthase